VKVEGITTGEIRQFNWSNFSPIFDDGANPASQRINREQALNNLIAHKQNFWSQFPHFFEQRKISGDSKLQDAKFLFEIKQAALLAILKNCKHNNAPIAEHLAFQNTAAFIQQRDNAEKVFGQQLKQYGDFEQILQDCAKEACLSSIWSLPDNTFRELMPVNWAGKNFLQFQFAAWFAAWHGAFEYNRINRFYAINDGEKDLHYFTDENFVKHFGVRPWELTNRVLEASGIRYRVNHPTTSYQSLETHFNLRLVDPVDKVEVQVNDLSSGEKIILAIILLLYQTSGEIGLAQMPKLLLLDEVDAPLHPSYTKSLIDILHDQLVVKCGLKIILTTHSPSTVALAPKETTFEIVRNPRQIRSITPSQATQILSAGFVSITSSDVIVITESNDDSEYYQQVFAACIEHQLLAEIPLLKFVAASGKNASEGGGHPQVKNWASKLHEIGLERFRGLIDKDSGNVGDQIVNVLLRYSVENYIYDPLTIAGFLVHKGVSAPFPSLSLPRMCASELTKLNATQLQTIIDEFCNWLMKESGEAEISESKPVAAHYVGLPELKIPEWWIETNGHEMEALLRARLNPFCSQHQRGALIRNNRDEIITFQSKTFPEAISRDLVEIFTRLQSAL